MKSAPWAGYSPGLAGSPATMVSPCAADMVAATTTAANAAATTALRTTPTTSETSSRTCCSLASAPLRDPDSGRVPADAAVVVRGGQADGVTAGALVAVRDASAACGLAVTERPAVPHPVEAVAGRSPEGNRRTD